MELGWRVAVGDEVGAADEWPGLVNDSIGKQEHCYYGQIARVSLCSVLVVFVTASAAASPAASLAASPELLLPCQPLMDSCVALHRHRVRDLVP